MWLGWILPWKRDFKDVDWGSSSWMYNPVLEAVSEANPEVNVAWIKGLAILGKWSALKCKWTVQSLQRMYLALDTYRCSNGYNGNMPFIRDAVGYCPSVHLHLKIIRCFWAFAHSHQSPTSRCR